MYFRLCRGNHPRSLYLEERLAVVMPSSVIKRKQKISVMSQEEVTKYFANFSLESIVSMEKRHCVKPGTYTKYASRTTNP